MSAQASQISSVIDGELRARLARPQRHRLLHGYPMAPLMRPVRGFDAATWVESETARPLLIGVLPHTACNPRVRGCGFCTFPHERFERARVEECASHVCAEIEARGVPALAKRRVGAVYFGGGTANLTPAASFARLCRTLEARFDLRDAEITLEGVPAYFALQGGALLDVLGDAVGRHKRISMGVQTLDEAWIARMGRSAFGDREQVRAVVEEAHRRGFTASADMLVNLPGRSLAENVRDIEAAVALGVDQVCAYNLVLASSHDAPWARDPEMVAQLAGNGAACTVWRAARQVLLDAGFVQTTLTNFERREIAGTARAFFYEAASFAPGTWDAIGFGPGAISTMTGARGRAVKWANAGTMEEYGARMTARGEAVVSAFRYGPRDVRLLHLTRGFSKMVVGREGYRGFFGSDAVADFAGEMEALERARLVAISAREIRLTLEGAFHADAVVGLLAARRVAALRSVDEGGVDAGHMG